MKILRLGDGAPTAVLKSARQHGHSMVNQANTSPEAVILSGAKKKDVHQAQQALASGIPVFCATPRASGTILEALVEHGQMHKTLVYVPYHRRVSAPYSALANQVAEGKSGEVGFIKIHANQPIPRGYTPTKGSPCAEVILNEMVQDIDWLHLNFGPIKKVFCQGTQQFKPKTEYAMATFTLKKGVIAQVIHSYQTTVIPSLRAEICGTAGMVQYDSADTPIRQIPARSEKEQAALDAATRWSSHWIAFGDLVIRGTDTAKDARSYVAPAQIATLAVQSVKTNRPFSV